ncbi:MAG: transcription-repair coupling factor [Rhodospirillales bacterium]|nr:transcription-repair coupling factor [Rhodospirillales bacterium]
MEKPGRRLIGGAPEGADALVVAELAQGRDLIFVAKDDVGAARLEDALKFFAPAIERLRFPAWDVLPYDRAPPLAEIVSRRIDALTGLCRPRPRAGRIVLTTVAALLQRVPPRASFADAQLTITAVQKLDPAAVAAFAERHGYRPSDVVMEPGEFAVRGGIVDLFPPGRDEPLRFDFFGDTLEQIRAFNPESQRTSERLATVELKPMSEIALSDDAVARFRVGYRALFGAVGDDDPLYQAVSAGKRHVGMEHWLPLFHDRLETLIDYAPDAVIALDPGVEAAADERLALIAEYYTARRDVAQAAPSAAEAPYRPLPPNRLYLDRAAWDELLAGRPVAELSPFAPPEDLGGAIDAGGRTGPDFAHFRTEPNGDPFAELGRHLVAQRALNRIVVLTGQTPGSRDRLISVLREHSIEGLAVVEDWAGARTLGGAVGVTVLGLGRGFETPGLAIVTEEDIFGERLIRPARRRGRPENFISEVAALNQGDLIVHADHGIGRFERLETIEVSGAPHDCLRLIYAGDDKLFLPVENIELVSRYGSEMAWAQLDKLGAASWQARKSKTKTRLREMAEELIKIAAARKLRRGVRLVRPTESFEEFCARFPFQETEDQARAIDDTLADLETGHPTDRLICGDVGFGKTEVVLRAAFVTVMSGKQVAVVVPTTLLARQHYQVFRARFAEFPVRIAQLSRLVTPKQADAIKAELKEGKIEIVIGTHALLSQSIGFKDLGLLVVDEEQHFGVRHKERLKQLKADVHVLTLSATPIPRTLQMALLGVRDLSLISTPPVDRLAVRTFVTPYDRVVIREALLREHHRGGQSFYVCPRIEDIDELLIQLKELAPELKLAVAHGQMATKQIEDTMASFYDGAVDVLLSTQIIESGLDLPRVNTIVIHRADMFGLAQLYQLRGRVGRSKIRAYAYLTIPARQALTETAAKRLEVMQTLDSLGAGFSLASYDLDIRGAGNLLGEEQSGHIREVGIDLYQQLLEDAVAAARSEGIPAASSDTDWSPQISTGIPVLIPETYVADLGVRMGLYRRIATIADPTESESFAAELIDRFGPLPSEVENLLQTVAVKHLCLKAGVERIEAGPRGAVLSFREGRFANPQGLVDFVIRQPGAARVRPDQKLVLTRAWDDGTARLAGVKATLEKLVHIASQPN